MLSLFVNYYIDSNKERQKEIDYCLQKNIENELIDNIFLIHSGIELPKSKKVIGITLENRPTYNDFFRIADVYDGIKIISNTDIYFNDTIRYVERIRDNQVYALNRWDEDKGMLTFFNKTDSQDAWIYKGKAQGLNADFTLGIMGCDNVIAYELDKIGFDVLSPSEDIQAVHVHKSNLRHYNINNSLNKRRPYKVLKLIRFSNIPDYKILFKFPVRERKDKFFETLDKYYSLMSGSNFEFVISMDEDDRIMNCETVRVRLNKYNNLTYFYNETKTKIDACNANIPTEWDIVVLVSDDMIPQVKGYDDIIREQMAFTFPDTDGVLWFNDGSKNTRNLNTLSILGKKYYDRFGFIYYPEYKSYWCDLEFQVVSQKLNRVIYINECIIRHEHNTFGYCKADSLYNSQTNDKHHDKSLYEKREKMNFKQPIPKIAYFIWSKGTPLSYLRYLTLETFRKYHPDYKMYLYQPTAIENKNWNGTITQEYYSKDKSEIEDYLPKCNDLGVEIMEYDKYSNLNPTQIADLFRFEQIYKTGGWFFDLDQIFINRIPDELTYSNFVFGGKKIPYIGVVGAIKGSLSCLEIINYQMEELKGTLPDYQSLGNILLHKYIHGKHKEEINQVDDEIFYPIYWDNVGDLYEGKVDIFKLNSIAIHWHGGYPASQVFNKAYTKELAKTSMDSFSRWFRGEKKEDEAIKNVFTEIANKNAWGDKDSISGSGSNLIQTKEIIRRLPLFLKGYKIKSMLDIPCGDFYWMKEVNLDGVDYQGADIVSSIIEDNKKYGKEFKVLDLVNSNLPKVDLIFCRDCLVHLPYSEIKKALINCKNSGSKYLLTTSFPKKKNVDIKLGGWRPLNLEAYPFNLRKLDIINEGCTENNGLYSDKSLILINLQCIQL